MLLGTLPLPEKNTNGFILGIDEGNAQVNLTLDKMVHALVAGTTGSGKSVFIKDHGFKTKN